MGSPGPGVAGPQDDAAAESAAVRIAHRAVRVSREADGGYRVVEVLDIGVHRRAADDTAGFDVGLIRLPDAADELLGLGGDVPPSRLRRQAGEVTLPVPPSRRFRVGFTYRLPPDATELRLAARWPVDSLTLDIARGSIRAGVRSPALTATPAAGQRPQDRYSARALKPERVVEVELISRRIGVRERLAVLLVTAAAALAAGVWVWRRPAPGAAG